MILSTGQKFIFLSWLATSGSTEVEQLAHDQFKGLNPATFGTGRAYFNECRNLLVKVVWPAMLAQW
jgi:hypothetical protein